ncbi:hypothetical protein A3197_17685 [Candidatus Thiodiazotropha endoloripes]|nr:hypothetical protein A3197_17685 [Candidatus Thiodiazotropha endoloripes]
MGNLVQIAGARLGIERKGVSEKGLFSKRDIRVLRQISIGLVLQSTFVRIPSALRQHGQERVLILKQFIQYLFTDLDLVSVGRRNAVNPSRFID